MTSAVTAVTLLSCALAAPAQAQGIYNTPSGHDFNPSWYIAPSINGISPDDKFGSDDQGGGLGLRVGKPLTHWLDLQLGTTYSRAHEGSSSYRQNTLGVDALFLLSRERFRPFLLAGGGAEYDKVNRPDLSSNGTSPYLNMGLGAQYSFNSQWGLQADYRHAVSFLQNNDFGFDRGHSNIVTVALLYTFDKPAAPAPIARNEAPPPPPPRAIEAPPPAPVPQRFERYTLSSTELFDFDSFVLRGSQPKLDEISSVLNRDPAIESINILGYTDRLGSDQYNQKLSQSRAEAVKSYLISKSVDARRLNAVGKGERNPVVECSDKKRADLIKCLEPNRRVEVEEIVLQRRVP
ncbi:OmpA family protein [Uliginosibacterium aquaticum]|nr:OmpA family protein [Uliginosibacterium aquaticum]